VIGVGGALAGALVLLLVLLAWVWAEASSKDSRSDWGAADQEQGKSVEACSPEIVSQLFSAADSKFISGLESPGLENLFRRERTAVALHWVQETSAFISRIMRRHLEASRLSADLEIAVEARIFLQYARLKLYCGTLFVLIGLLGPQRLAGTALYAERFIQRVGEGLVEFQLAARLREPDGSESL
jgi:hypothetical protein